MNYTFNFLILAISLCTFEFALAQDKATLNKGDYVASFTEVDDKGNSISLEDYKGKVVLLNFTATWCGPCWETYVPMDDLQKQYQEDLVIISFHMDNMEKKWKKKAASKRITFDVISIWQSDTIKALHKSFAPKLYPSFVLLDPSGKIHQKWDGNSENMLRKNVKKAVRRFM